MGYLDAMTPTALRMLRLRKLIPARTVAARIGVSPSMLCKWERGVKEPTGERLKAWRKALR